MGPLLVLAPAAAHAGPDAYPRWRDAVLYAPGVVAESGRLSGTKWLAADVHRRADEAERSRTGLCLELPVLRGVAGAAMDSAHRGARGPGDADARTLYASHVD